MKHFYCVRNKATFELNNLSADDMHLIMETIGDGTGFEEYCEDDVAYEGDYNMPEYVIKPEIIEKYGPYGSMYTGLYTIIFTDYSANSRCSELLFNEIVEYLKSRTSLEFPKMMIGS